MSSEDELKKQVLSNKGKIKIGDLRLHALINILCKEGVVTEEEIEEELNKLLEGEGSQ